jgi:putative membrane protein
VTDEARDATRRTRLANERTYLAWWRSGLTALAVAVGTGKIAPAIGADLGTDWLFQLVGAGFGAIGVLFVLYAYVRQRAVERALERGAYVPLDPRFALVLTLATALLGAMTIWLLLPI